MARRSRLADRSEFDWIARIARVAEAAGRGAGVPLGIGDDAALLRPRPGEDVAVTTDAMQEDVHFRFATASPRSLGLRAAGACLSDLAAMGARPLGMLVALAAPPTLPGRTLMAVARGLAEAAGLHGCPLVGGNLTRAPSTSLTTTALGGVRRGRALRRDAARPGDRLCVTGEIGGQALALARAERHGAAIRRVPEPRLEAGRRLSRQGFAGACIDLSDGLVADLRHVLAASGVGARLEPAALPLPRGFAAACAREGLDPLGLACLGGEDYELLFSVRAGAPSVGTLSRRLGVSVSEIGHITRARGLRGLPAGVARKGGWRHF